MLGTGGGGIRVELLFMENIFAAHSARREKNSRPTQHRAKIFNAHSSTVLTESKLTPQEVRITLLIFQQKNSSLL